MVQGKESFWNSLALTTYMLSEQIDVSQNLPSERRHSAMIEKDMEDLIASVRVVLSIVGADEYMELPIG